MADVAKRYVDESEKIEKQIRDSYNYFKKNVDQYHACRKAVFETSITDADEVFIQQTGFPTLECNVIEPYISRLRGEFSKQTPSIRICSLSNGQDNPQLNDVLEGHYRAILQDAEQNQMSNEVLNDTLSGGFCAIKVWTEYESNSSFNQIIKIGRVFDPTLCFFDPITKFKHKGDGQYCGEHIPMRKDEVERVFNIDLKDESFLRNSKDQFSWFYETQDVQVALVTHFYKKKYKTRRMVLLADGNTLEKGEYQKHLANWNSIAEPPKIVKERNVKDTVICRYTLVGGTVVEYQETDFRYLPIVYVDGNSEIMRDAESGYSYQLCRPYVYHAIDAQRIKNFMAQTFVNEIQSMVQHKFMMPINAIPHKSEQLEPWLNNQKQAVLLWNEFDSQGRPNTPPQPVQRQPIPPEVYSAFMGADETIRNVLSTFDPNLGVNQSALSGVAIVEGATQSNAVAMPYIMNLMASYTQVAVIILDLIPKYYLTPRTIPTVDGEGKHAFKMINTPDSISMKYDPSSLKVTVKSAVNFEVQKQRSLETMATMAQSFPAFAEMINQMGLPVLVDNLDIRGGDKLKQMAEQFEQQQMQIQQQQQQQGQQMNPQMIMAQLKAQELQSDQQYKQGQLQIQQQKVMADAQNDASQNQINMLKLQLQEQQMAINAQNQKETLDLNTYQTLLQAQLDAKDQSIQIQKAGVEQEGKIADLQMAAMDMGHKHALDIHDRLNKPSDNPESV